ncbi:hypothetical protein CTI14_66170, partial [Methylobacterium radiotolerans]
MGRRCEGRSMTDTVWWKRGTVYQVYPLRRGVPRAARALSASIAGRQRAGQRLSVGRRCEGRSMTDTVWWKRGTVYQVYP